MNKEKGINDIPSLNTQIKFLSNVMRKRIEMMKYFIDNHFDSSISKQLRESGSIDIDFVIGNTRDASTILDGLKEKDELEYIPHDLDELALASSLLGRVELPIFHHIAEIYKALTKRNKKK